jgi:hypothetical protein
MSSLTERMIGAAKLDVRIYEEVENDASATGQAMLVVVLSALAAGVGVFGQLGAIGLVASTVAALLGWFVWAFLTYYIGTKLLPEPGTHADLGQLLRAIGFSSSPGLLRVLGLIPLIGGLLMLALSVWMLIAMVIAVRQALDYTSTGRSIVVCLIGWVLYIAFNLAVGAVMMATGLAGAAGPG